MLPNNKRNRCDSATGNASGGGVVPLKKVRSVPEMALDPDALLNDPLADEYCTQVLELSSIPSGALVKTSTGNQPPAPRKFFKHINRDNSVNNQRLMYGSTASPIGSSKTLPKPSDMFLKPSMAARSNSKTIPSAPPSRKPNSGSVSKTPGNWSSVGQLMAPRQQSNATGTVSSRVSSPVPITSTQCRGGGDGRENQMDWSHVSETNVSMIPCTQTQTLTVTNQRMSGRQQDRNKRLEEKKREQEEFLSVMRPIQEWFRREAINKYSKEKNVVNRHPPEEEVNETRARIYHLLGGKGKVMEQARENILDIGAKYFLKSSSSASDHF